MQNDYEIFAVNAAPFNTIKLISAGYDCVKKHIVEISAQAVLKKSQLSAQSTKSVIIVKQKCYITSIAMSNDTHTLFVANDKHVITQFQKEESSLNYYPVRTLKGHYNVICSLSLSNSKIHLLSASYDETLRVWDLQNGTQLACLNGDYKEHQSQLYRCCWNDKDTLFASGDSRGDVVVWSPPLSIYNSSNLFISIYKFKVRGDKSQMFCLKFQENGLDLFASYCYSNVIRLWRINEKELLDSKSTHQQNASLSHFQRNKFQSKKLNGWIFSFDVRGSMLVVGVNKQILSLSADSLQSMADAVEFEKVHYGKIHSLVFSKDGKYVVSGSEYGSVAIFDSKSGKCMKQIKAHSTEIKTVVFEI